MYKDSIWDGKGEERHVNTRHALITYPSLLEAMTECTSKSILDIGCGNGYILRKLREQGAEVSGIDIEEAMLQRCSDFNGQVRMGSSTDIPFEDNRFDIVYSNCVFSSLSHDNLKNSFKEASRVTKPNGEVIICDIHPCHPYVDSPLVEKQRYICSYFLSHGRRALLKSADHMGSGSVINYVHHPLADYLNGAIEADLTLNKVVEPKPSEGLIEKYPDLYCDLTQPSFILYKFSKGERQ